MSERQIFERYAAVQTQIAELEAERDALKPQVVAAVSALNPDDEKVAVEGVGTFVNMTRRKYRYSGATEDMYEAVKAAREREEQEGLAVYSESKYVVFKRE